MIVLLFFLAIMHFAIQFNDKGSFRADEVDNIRSDWPLTLEAGLMVVKKIIPQVSLRGCHALAKLL